MGYPPCRKRWSTGRTTLAPSIPLRKRQLPVRFSTEQGKACAVERKTTWERGKRRGADTVPQASAASTRESPVSDHPAGISNSTTGHSTFCLPKLQGCGKLVPGDPTAFISNLLSGKDRVHKVSP